MTIELSAFFFPQITLKLSFRGKYIGKSFKAIKKKTQTDEIQVE